eukprot:Cvel_32293.t1-p1 / transcript=Cvel_32293.t1 / gene=Cvel_32293 / organism=Chromera_velia_CCMP2878 / gene_product=hypothetical protein / transcript_product=hypothetical protein / location=Cvel_scaffold4994:3359-6684(+) / protein_length=554 / sequence_SO=supercontig / SO=protein_coding / is_pseudo=false
MVWGVREPGSEKRRIFSSRKFSGQTDRGGIGFCVVPIKFHARVTTSGKGKEKDWIYLDSKKPLLGLDEHGNDAFLFLPNFLSPEVARSTDEAIETFYPEPNTKILEKMKYDLGSKFLLESDDVCPVGGVPWDPRTLAFREKLSPIVSKTSEMLPRVLPPEQVSILRETAALGPEVMRGFWGEFFSAVRLNYNLLSDAHLDDHDVNGAPTLLLPFGEFKGGAFEMHNLSVPSVGQKGMGIHLVARPGSAILFHGYKIVHSVDWLEKSGNRRHSLAFSVQKYVNWQERAVYRVSAEARQAVKKGLEGRRKVISLLQKERRARERSRKTTADLLEDLRQGCAATATRSSSSSSVSLSRSGTAAASGSLSLVSDLARQLVLASFEDVQRVEGEQGGWPSETLTFLSQQKEEREGEGDGDHWAESLSADKSQKDKKKRRPADKIKDGHLYVHLDTGETVNVTNETVCSSCDQPMTEETTLELNRRQPCAYCAAVECFDCAGTDEMERDWKCPMCVQISKGEMSISNGGRIETTDSRSPFFRTVVCGDDVIGCGGGGYLL